MSGTVQAATRRAAGIVAGLNLAYFGLEFAVALAIGSVSLFADSMDFLEDASVNMLVVLALRWSATRRAKVGRVMALLLLAPACATLVTAARKLAAPVAPAPLPFSLTAAGALAVNLASAVLLARHRTRGGSLTRAAFLSARNDVFSNLAMLAAALVTARRPTAWPDLAVGLGIAVLNADAAREVWEAAKAEHEARKP